ncbi:MAG: endonuclease [Mesorhizobium sp.]|nr:MAG: endonuclease [Mesorhizobium sp.]
MRIGMLFDLLNGALRAMAKGPKPLGRSLKLSAEINDLDERSATLDALLSHLDAASAGDSTANTLRRALAGWDNESGADWCTTTERNTTARRTLIYKLLDIPEAFAALCEQKFPFKPLDAPVVIAKAHSIWYDESRRRAQSFYWDAYVKQLERQGWQEDSIRQLDDSTSKIVERLADPADERAYQTKGIVVGYVQSGKTANFTGVVAKAADAGYKLIILLAGTLDVLRSQTQRRIDKEMVGQELLDKDYVSDADWDQFLKHGSRPATLGAFDWYRLTGPESDYQKLGRGVEAIQFEAADHQKPFWHRDNLAGAKARIAIVKKNPSVLKRLLGDLKLLQRRGVGAPLDQIPTLIIDDESDQASINVRASTNGITPTNDAITEFLRILPRSQYVGYTATPFANVFVDPSNEEDLFPKDFMISLPRPDGYMGVRDFYDLDGRDDDITSRPNERDYVRDLKGDDTKPDNLQKAIDCFILAGAIKKYRSSKDPNIKYRHHTMLAHSSARVADHDQLAALVRATLKSAAYDGKKGQARLRTLFLDDFQPVSQRQAADLPFPVSFEELAPYVGECLTEIGDPSEAVRVLNNENKADTPDFDKVGVWKILVGGTKLSRGYTVEGLTISYYRRRAATADTLMQMGRWFGFRPKYRDLVRLFIGREESVGRGGRTIDLYKAFGAICRDEEMFREELKRYADLEDRITPLQIPPLVPSHMLQPTATNKMFNAQIAYSNFGGQLSESTFAPDKDADIRHNHDALLKLIERAAIRTDTLVATSGKRIEFAANLTTATPAAMIEFLKSFRWFNKGSEGKPPFRLQVEFLEKTGKYDPGIKDWLIIAPQSTTPRDHIRIGGVPFAVIYRTYTENRFGTYNDPKHRALAQYIAYEDDLEAPNDALKSLRKKGRGVMLYYPITSVEKGKAKPPYSTGFTLLFPKNDIQEPIRFKVVQQNRPNAPVVAAT